MSNTRNGSKTKRPRPTFRANTSNEMKRITGILGIIISIIAFSIYYQVAVATYPNVPAIFIKFSYYSLFIGLALVCLSLGINSETRIKNLIYYTGSSFWSTIFLCYLLKDSGIINSRNMSIHILIGTSILCFILYFFKPFR